jgi:hypothetical protein
LLVGLTLGLLGGGGSILMLPLLVYVAGSSPSTAVTLSLLVVGVTSAVALVPHARAGHVQWRVGIPFGVAGMAGAYRDLYHHLAESCEELADKPTRERLEDRAGRLLANVPVRENREGKPGAGASEREIDVKPPRPD